MVTLYMKGSAETIDGVSVDYIVVSESEVGALLAAGWVKNISELSAAT